jgi:predicted nucleic acid-binding Zn finger protein
MSLIPLDSLSRPYLQSFRIQRVHSLAKIFAGCTFSLLNSQKKHNTTCVVLLGCGIMKEEPQSHRVNVYEVKRNSLRKRRAFGNRNQQPLD